MKFQCGSKAGHSGFRVQGLGFRVPPSFILGFLGAIQPEATGIKGQWLRECYNDMDGGLSLLEFDGENVRLPIFHVLELIKLLACFE